MDLQPGVWTKASRCSNSACVEACLVGDTVLVRDRFQNVAEVERDHWTGFLNNVTDNGTAHSEVVAQPASSDGDVLLSYGPTLLYYTSNEWAVFVDGVKSGEFGLEARPS